MTHTEDVLEKIRDDLAQTRIHAARTDERTEQIQQDLADLKENRIAPLEDRVAANEKRSRRNTAILGGLGTIGSLVTTKLLGLIHLKP